MKKLLNALLVVGLSTSLIAGSGFSSGGSRSSGGSSSSSSGSRSSGYSSGGSKSSGYSSTPSKPSSGSGYSSSPSKPTGSGYSSTPSSKPTSGYSSTTSKPSSNTTAPKVTTADIKTITKSDPYAAARAKDALKGNTVSQQDYISKFKTDNATKYPNKFVAEPTTRPTYIPPVYTDNTSNKSYNIVFNHSYGGYGYMNSYGIFVGYDPLDSIAAASYS